MNVVAKKERYDLTLANMVYPSFYKIDFESCYKSLFQGIVPKLGIPASPLSLASTHHRFRRFTKHDRNHIRFKKALYLYGNGTGFYQKDKILNLQYHLLTHLQVAW